MCCLYEGNVFLIQILWTNALLHCRCETLPEWMQFVAAVVKCKLSQKNNKTHHWGCKTKTSALFYSILFFRVTLQSWGLFFIYAKNYDLKRKYSCHLNHCASVKYGAASKQGTEAVRFPPEAVWCYAWWCLYLLDVYCLEHQLRSRWSGTGKALLKACSQGATRRVEQITSVLRTHILKFWWHRWAEKQCCHIAIYITVFYSIRLVF